MKRKKRKEKGAGVSASPPVSPDVRTPRLPQGAARAFMSAASPDPRRQGWRTRAVWPVVGERLPSAGHRGGGDPEGSATHLDVLAPPLPCGIGFAVSVIKARRSRRIIAFQWPRPVHLAPKSSHVPCVGCPAWLMPKHPPALTTCSAFCPKAWASRFGRLACPCSGGAFPALAARLSHAEAWTRRFGHRIRFVSIPPALASGTGRFPGWCPRIVMHGFPKAPVRVDPLQASDFALISRRVFVRLQG